ncbi:unnamed protein product [Clonostachys chloroleuca]|uniref:Beta-mannosidase B n=1 Tax=Clonostachys chloroleuca TaxID=1926264 RepID=A0AA35M928_9HYPO|nr:unnamed protein product [Clonostachys chloroleuca]
MPSIAQRTPLELGWSFKSTQDGNEDWKPVARVPTVVHQDLMDNGILSDPFRDLKEIDAEWVERRSWTYRTTFPAPKDATGASVHLLFDGLDTFANVQLNNTVILESDNMFLSHRVDITKIIKSENTLVIDFDSAMLRGRALKNEHPDHKFVLFNGEAGRLAVRKAQYHWGWDWGPKLMTAGPWRPVRLEVSWANINDTVVKYELSQDLMEVNGDIKVDVEGEFDEIHVSVRFQDDIVFHKSTTALEFCGAVASLGRTAIIPFAINDPKLWFPVGYGGQPLYDVDVYILKDGQTLDSWSRKTGFRRSELVQVDDSHGQSFYFRINGIDIFCGGSCWIPADSLLPRITADKYRKWLQLMVEGNQIMTRVWGGGIYEEDAFYDACDELGLLVWQDFMFACGNYPVWPSFVNSIREEAKQNVRRLRHHPSVVIFAGNNEDYQVQESENLEYNYEDKDPESWLKSTYPARYYYEHLLPQVVAQESSGVVYWPGSPFSNGKPTPDPTVGDLHQWNVWHGMQRKYQTFNQLGGRFNSEFGMEAFPALQTIEYFVTNRDELFPQSQTMDFHNKADGHERRIATYLVENFRPKEDLKSHIYLTQLCQAEALSYAYRGWRRQWGEERHCGGVLVWQLNDCWPGTSWSIVDYFLRKKPSFYAIARTLEPLAVAVEREHHDWSVCHARPAETSSFAVWVASSEQMESKVDVEVRFISVKTGSDIKGKILQREVSVQANSTTEILSGNLDNVNEEPHVIAVRLFLNGTCVSRSVDWPQPLKYLDFSERGVKVKLSNGECHITADKPTKGLVLEESDDITLSDNCVDVVPGDEIVIQATGTGTVVNLPNYIYLGQP